MGMEVGFLVHRISGVKFTLFYIKFDMNSIQTDTHAEEPAALCPTLAAARAPG